MPQPSSFNPPPQYKAPSLRDQVSSTKVDGDKPLSKVMPQPKNQLLYLLMNGFHDTRLNLLKIWGVEAPTPQKFEGAPAEVLGEIG